MLAGGCLKKHCRVVRVFYCLIWDENCYLVVAPLKDAIELLPCRHTEASQFRL